MNTALHSFLKNMVEAPIEAGDYSRVTSVPELIRTALLAHANGMRLTEKAIIGPKRRFSIGLDSALMAFYKSLPTGRRTEIIDRALRTYLRSDRA